MRVSTIPDSQDNKHNIKVSLALETIRGAFPEQVRQTIKMKSLQGAKVQHSVNQTHLLLRSRNNVHILSPYTGRKNGRIDSRTVLLFTLEFCETKITQRSRIKTINKQTKSMTNKKNVFSCFL